MSSNSEEQPKKAPRSKYTGQISNDRGCLHPRLVADYKPQESLKIKKESGPNQYGSLNDDSPFAEYAWEFLRRNRFYQAMIDNARPYFNIDDWGYRPRPGYPSICGLMEPYKHYSESYGDNPPEWKSFWEIETRIKDAMLQFRRQKQVTIEYPGQQVAFFFDLEEVFGPGVIGLKKQADIAVKQIMAHLGEQALASESEDIAAKSTYRSNKADLRRYLRLADLLTIPQAIESNGDTSTGKKQRRVLTIKEAALRLPPYDFGKKDKSDEEKIKSAYDFADEAREYIYGWKCLTLLTFEDDPKKTKMEQSELQNNNTGDASNMDLESEN